MIVNLKDSWIVQLHNNVEKGKLKINRRDISFFNIDMIEQAARHTVIYIKHCTQCQENKQLLLNISENFPKMLNTIQGRKEFTNNLDHVIKHLRVAHGVYPRGYFTAIYTFIALIIAAVFAWIVAKINLLSMYASMLIFLGIGMIIGWIIGQIKDSKISKLGKRLDKNPKIEINKI